MARLTGTWAVETLVLAFKSWIFTAQPGVKRIKKTPGLSAMHRVRTVEGQGLIFTVAWLTCQRQNMAVGRIAGLADQ